MITYEVYLDVAPHLADSLERYMRDTHIPDIVATGCFAQIAFERASATHFRTRYQAISQAKIDQYLAEHTGRMRDDFAAHFPEGVSVRREQWDDVKRWDTI